MLSVESIPDKPKCVPLFNKEIPVNEYECKSISRAGNSRSCTRFCVEYACSMRKVQGSNPGGCLMTFYDLLFFHHF